MPHIRKGIDYCCRSLLDKHVFEIFLVVKFLQQFTFCADDTSSDQNLKSVAYSIEFRRPVRYALFDFVVFVEPCFSVEDCVVKLLSLPAIQIRPYRIAISYIVVIASLMMAILRLSSSSSFFLCASLIVSI